MSVIRPKPPEDPLLVAPAVLSTVEAARFEAVRAAAMADEIVRGPERILAAYGASRPTSELFDWLTRARRVRESVDRVVFVAAGAAHHLMRLVFDTCCHPFHNDLDRGERGGRPRLFFAGQDFDGDAASGLLDLVTGPSAAGRDDLLDRFGILVADDADREGSVRAAMQLLEPTLRDATHGEPGDRLVAVPAAGASPFGAAMLLPAAVVGVDIVRLLEGAVAMNARFAESPPATNPVAFMARPVPEARGGARLRCRESGRLASLGAWQEAIGGDVAAVPVVDVEVTTGEPRRDPLVDPFGVPWHVRSTRGREVAGVRLPRLDEHATGQLLQMLAIATVVGRGLAASAPPEH